MPCESARGENDFFKKIEKGLKYFQNIGNGTKLSFIYLLAPKNTLSTHLFSPKYLCHPSFDSKLTAYLTILY